MAAISACVYDPRTQLLAAHGWVRSSEPDAEIKFYNHSGDLIGQGRTGLKRDDVVLKHENLHSECGWRFSTFTELPKALHIRAFDSSGKEIGRTSSAVAAMSVDDLFVRSKIHYCDSEDQAFGINAGNIEFQMRFDGFLKPGSRVPDTIDLRINGQFEVETLNVLKALVRSGHHVLEIGARFGYFTCILSQLVGPSGHILSFEGEMAAAKVLDLNVNLNQLPNVSVVKNFLTADGSDGSVSVNEVRNSSSTFDLAFMDIEGAEFAVIPAILEANLTRAILFEKHPRNYPENVTLGFFRNLAEEHKFDFVEFDGLALMRKT